MKLGLYLTTTHENYLEMDYRPKRKSGNHKTPRKKIRKKVFDMDLRNDFLGMTPKAQAAKSKVNSGIVSD